MSLPSPSLSVPTLAVDQAQFNGPIGNILFGATTPFEWTKVEGIGRPKNRNNNMPRPRVRGAFVGLALPDTRTITFTLDIGPPFGSFTNLKGALSAARNAFADWGTTEYPLWIQLPNYPLFACMARVTGFDPPYDFAADIGGLGTGLMKGIPLQFEATDPYFYQAPTVSTSLGLPTPGVGFSFPITFNLSFGGASGGNTATITNSGDVPCYPTLVIAGPCLNPTVQNLSVSGSPILSFNIQLNSGDVLTVDCDQQSILYTPSGQSVGSPYPQILNSGSTFWVLQPGSNMISFNSADTSLAAGTLAIWNTSAYDGFF